MRRHGKRDRNHSDVVGWYRELGCLVSDTGDLGSGFPDILVCVCGLVELVEIKTPEGTLTKDQREFHALWPVTVVRNHADVVIHVGNMRKRAMK